MRLFGGASFGLNQRTFLLAIVCIELVVLFGSLSVESDNFFDNLFKKKQQDNSNKNEVATDKRKQVKGRDAASVAANGDDEEDEGEQEDYRKVIRMKPNIAKLRKKIDDEEVDPDDIDPQPTKGRVRRPPRLPKPVRASKHEEEEHNNAEAADDDDDDEDVKQAPKAAGIRRRGGYARKPEPPAKPEQEESKSKGRSRKKVVSKQEEEEERPTSAAEVEEDERTSSSGKKNWRSFAAKIDVEQFTKANRKKVQSEPNGEPLPKKRSKFVKSGKFLKRTMNSAYKATKNGIKTAITELPKVIEQTNDRISAILKLDSKGRLLALIDDVNDDIALVKEEFSTFSLQWAPIIERILNFIGDKNLNKLKWDEGDDLDFRGDALYALAFGYELMNVFIPWRENLLIAHEAYKAYLEAIRPKVQMPETSSERVIVDENFIFRHKTIHAYLLHRAWTQIQMQIAEPQRRLDKLMEVCDQMPKNYESDYFRYIVEFQERYEPLSEVLADDFQQIQDTVADLGIKDNMEKVDDFLEEFQDALAAGDLPNVKWAAPEELHEFMEKLEPELNQNTRIYEKKFLREAIIPETE